MPDQNIARADQGTIRKRNRLCPAMQFPLRSVMRGRAQARRSSSLIFKDLMPDLVIADITLPDISGVDVLRMLRAEGVTVPFLILTMHGVPFVATLCH